MEEFSVSVGKQNASILVGRMGLEPVLSPTTDTNHKTRAGETGEQNNYPASDQATPNVFLPCRSDLVSIPVEEKENGLRSLKPRFEDELHKHIPENSPLLQSIRSRDSSALIINEPNAAGASSPLHSLVGNLRHISSRCRSTALIIQDINPGWAQVLLDEYPNSIDATFFLEHMARFDSFTATDKAVEQLRGDIDRCRLKTNLSSSPIEGSRRIKRIEFEFFDRPPASHGNHIDMLFDDVTKDGVPPGTFYARDARRDVFEQATDGSWKKLSTRMSWCKLDEHIHLILVDSVPGFEKDLSWPTMRERPFQTLLDPRIDTSTTWTQSRLAIHYLKWTGPAQCIYSIVSQLLKDHTVQSVFDPKAVPVNKYVRKFRPQHQNTDDSQRDIGHGWGHRQVLLWLMTESTWYMALTTLEMKWQLVRLRVTKLPGDEAFVLLAGLRCQVADAQHLIAESKECCIRVIRESTQWLVDGEIVDADEFWSQKPDACTRTFFALAQSMDIRALPETFQKMEDRFNAMTRIINQEIQVVIGSVQVEDAKTMKRQTEWTVMLAVLAAVYLPMTLVTGIFGMNIVELTKEEGAPTRWSPVKTWGVVFGATIVSLILYVSGRQPVKWYLKRRETLKRKALDEEALKVE